MPAEYPLESLDPETFEQVAVALSRAVIGHGVTIFGHGPDGGREATYEGPVRWSNTTGFGDDSWDGYVVVQAKHRAALDPDPGRNLIWLRTQLARELDRWIAPQSSRARFPEYLLIVTDARLSPAVGGGIDTIEEYLQQRWTDQLRERGLKGWKVWHRDQVASLLVQHADVRRAFPSFLTSPNDKLLERFEKLEAFFEPRATHDLLVEHAAAALRNEQWVNFGEAGEDSQQPLHRVIVDLPVRRGASRGRALQQLMQQGEKVLRRSLTPDGTPRHVIITGAPGNGKSTLSRYLVQLYRAAFMAKDIPSPALLDLAKGTKTSMDRMGLELPRQQRWPMRVDLADWASGDERYTDYVIKWLGYKIAERAGRDVTVADVRRWLNEWPWLIVFDGLDEVTAPGVRRNIVNGIAEFIDEVDTVDADVLVIVTTRPGGYTDELPAEHFAEYELDYLSEREAIDYGELVTRGRMADDQDRRNEVLTRFRAAVADPATTRLLKTPLQVLIITFILEHAGALPPNRYGLFWTYYETLFKRETSKKNPLARFLSQRGQDVTHLHEMVGATLQVRSEGGQDSHARLSLSDIRHIADQRLRAVGYDDDMERHKFTEEMVAAATRRLLLLVPGGQDHAGEDTVMFEVRSLQELMAARHLSQGTPAQVRPRLTALAPSPHWRNTWVFMAGRLFAEPSDLSWNIVTDVLTSYDTTTGWPGWLIPVSPGLAADLLDDGLATTKPRWQGQLLDLALRALSEPLPIDLSVVARGLAAASLNPSYQKVTLATMKRALEGTESSRYAAARIAQESNAITPPHTQSQLVDELVIRSGRIKGRNRVSAHDLLEPDLRQLESAMSTPFSTKALEELKTLQLLEVGDHTVVVRPKNVADWTGLVTALEDPDGRAALELAVKAVDPQHWRLIHLLALEVFPALARRPVGATIMNTQRAPDPSYT